MHHAITFAGLVAMTGALGIRTPTPEPSAEARCLLGVLAAEGFRAAPHPSDSTRRVLTRTLTGISRRTGQPDPMDTRAELVEVRVDPGGPGLAVERVAALQPTGTGAMDGGSSRLLGEVQALLREAAPRCAAR